MEDLPHFEVKKDNFWDFHSPFIIAFIDSILGQIVGYEAAPGIGAIPTLINF